MRTALLISRDTAGKYSVVCDPSTSPQEQVAKFKAVCRGPKDGVVELALWTSTNGVIKRQQFRPKAAAPAAPTEDSAEPESAPRRKRSDK